MKTNTINYILGGCCTLLSSNIFSQPSISSERLKDNRPNIVLILADDMGRECLGTYGSCYNTPNLDQLAEIGIKFNNGFSQPLSTPSRVQLMTGKYNNKNYSVFEILNHTEKTFANLAKEAGYVTMISGKWQLGMNNKLPQHFGFDQYCLWNLNYKKNIRERYAKPLIEKDGNVILYSEDDYGPDIFSDYLIDFIETNKDKPFLAYYPMVLAHDPFYPTPDSEYWFNSNEREIAHNKNFPKMVEYTDKIVGKIITKLKSLNLWNNTIIIFVGDNGTARYIQVPMKDGTMIKGGKGMTKDTGVRVPLIVNWGKMKYKEHICNDMIDFSDFLPTLAEAMKIKVPQKWDIDGRSFLPQIKGQKGSPREWVFCHYDPQQSPGSIVNKFAGRFFRNIRYKLYSDGRLFDTVNDPDEKYPIKEGEGSAKAELSRKQLTQLFKNIPDWKIGDPHLPVHLLPQYPLRDTSKPVTLNEIIEKYNNQDNKNEK